MMAGWAAKPERGFWRVSKRKLRKYWNFILLELDGWISA
jgi:hypothetical protein